MSPKAQKIIDDLKVHMEIAFDSLVALVQEEAVNEMLSKFKVQPVIKEAPKKTVTLRSLPETLTKLQEEPTQRPIAHYDNPEDDPNYGMLGSDVISTGKHGSVVTIVEEDSSL
jgi:hypothetical protein